jgi:hypothetical protein
LAIVRIFPSHTFGLTDTLEPGYGNVTKTSLVNLLTKSHLAAKRSNIPIQGSIVHLTLASQTSSSSRVLVGGGDDGSVAIWDSE